MTEPWHHGTVKRWRHDKSFGFIRPDVGGPDMFVLLREFDRAGLFPREGARISFEIGIDRNGRPQAEALDGAGLPTDLTGLYL